MKTKDMSSKDMAKDLGKSILYNFGKLIGRSLKIIKEGYEEGKNEKVKEGGKNNKN